MKFNGQDISKIMFNSQEVTKAMLNGVDVHAAEKLIYTLKYMSIKKSGHYIYVRTPFDSTQDLTQQFYDDSTQIPSLQNPLFNFGYALLIDNTIPKTVAGNWVDGTNVHSRTDDDCPVQESGTYIGANHGANCVRNVTVASHDKTDADLGSVWQDAGTKTWYLIKVVDSTHLWFVTDFSINGTYGYWYYDTAIGASPLSHVSGATHTANVVFSSTAVTQILPSVKNIELSFLMDGKDAITEGVAYNERSFLEVTVDYDIARPPFILAYMKSNIGSTIQDALDDDSVTADIHVQDVHRFDSLGCCRHKTTLTTLEYIYQFRAGGIQSLGLTKTGRKIFEYLPGTLTIGGSDYTIPVDITSGISLTIFDSTYWKDSNKPPYRGTQILKTTEDALIIGFSLGYSLQFGDTIFDTRKTKVINRAFSLSADNKQYPQVVYDQNTPADTTITIHAFSGYYDPNNIGNATVFQCHQEENSLIAEIDYHTNVTNEILTLPVDCTGKTVTVLTSDGNITIGSTITTGLDITVADGYGSATVKIG